METIERIEAKLDRIMDDVSSIKATVAGQAVEIKRIDKMEKQMPVVLKHIAMVQGAAKILGAIGIFLGVVAGFIQALR